MYSSQVWRNFWTTQASYTLNRRHADARLTRGGPLMEVPQSFSHYIAVKTTFWLPVH